MSICEPAENQLEKKVLTAFQRPSSNIPFLQLHLGALKQIQGVEKTWFEIETFEFFSRLILKHPVSMFLT